MMGTVKIWDVTTGYLLGEYILPKSFGNVSSISMDYSCRKILLGFNKGTTIRVLNYANGVLLHELSCLQEKDLAKNKDKNVVQISNICIIFKYDVHSNTAISNC